jgi:hypothetical protein
VQSDFRSVCMRHDVPHEDLDRSWDPSFR